MPCNKLVQVAKIRNLSSTYTDKRISIDLLACPPTYKYARIRASEEERLCSWCAGYVCAVARSIGSLCTT